MRRQLGLASNPVWWRQIGQTGHDIDYKHLLGKCSTVPPSSIKSENVNLLRPIVVQDLVFMPLFKIPLVSVEQFIKIRGRILSHGMAVMLVWATIYIRNPLQFLQEAHETISGQIRVFPPLSPQHQEICPYLPSPQSC